MKAFKNEFVDQCLFRIDENSERIEKCFALLTEEQVWERPNLKSNSIGNLILHLCGNIQQYAISSLGEIEDLRQRSLEFESYHRINKEALLSLFLKTIKEAKMVITDLSTEKWLESREVQGFEFSGLGILIHVVEHLSYHVGQIAFYTKHLINQDLGFYAGIDLNKKNINF